jgi:hypothetical protein
MNLKPLLAMICCLITVAYSPPALAQEVSDLKKQNGEIHSLAGPRERPPWEASVGATWLPGRTVDTADAVGKLRMSEVKFGLTRRLSIKPNFNLSTGLQYSLRDIDAPEALRLPDSLHTVALHLGGEYHASDRLTLGIRVTPGLSSDFRSITTDDLRVPVALQAKYRVSQALTLTGGLAYTGQSHSIPILPVIGVLYLPTDKVTLAFGFPRTAIVYKKSRETELFLAAEFAGGEYGLHDSAIGADVIRYKDYRAVAGIEFPLLPVAKVNLSGGYAFSRKFEFYEGDRADVRVKSAPFGRMEVKFSW